MGFSIEMLTPDEQDREEYQLWFAGYDRTYRFALVRPDNYVYGFARNQEELTFLLHDIKVAIKAIS